MFPELLSTARLQFRPIAADDGAAIHDGWVQDAEVARYLTWRPHRSMDETIAYITRVVASTTSRTYVLVGKDDGKIRGAFDLRDIGHGRIGYGYVLARSYWGQGLMTEALTTAVDWAMAQPNIWRIGDICDVENTGSARVMEKAGLMREGMLRRWMMFPNLGAAPRDCYMYARTK